MNTGERCAEMVSRGYYQIRCRYPGKYEEDGKWWCGHHQPSAVRARREQNEAAWQAQRERETAVWEARQKADARAALCVAACTEVPDEMLLPGFVAKLLAAADEAGFMVAVAWEREQ